MLDLTPKDDFELELLAPAKNADQGIEAIRHGADAVYIGAPAFGARAAVPVTTQEIRRVCDYAHLFGARVYVALNTILYPEEVPQAIEMAHELYRIGADALIIQDLALLSEDMPPIPLHASTQMDNVTPEKLTFWSQMGMEQAVVARELSPRQIKKLHEAAPDLRLEAFVHGALCVSYSGRCYAAAAFHGRSANRGSCSQVCRLPFDLIDGTGQILQRNRHLLSIKDLNRSSVLSDLIDAGVRSFKIEGRLKDLAYVKNVTAHYHTLLDDYIRSHPEFRRASAGEVALRFKPDVTKAFSRGFTTFTHRGRGEDRLAAFATPKSMGEKAGVATKVSGREITISPAKGQTFSNGDGFTFFDPDTGALTGFRINTAAGDLLSLARPVKGLRKGTVLYRNHDRVFEAEMERPTAERTMPISFRLEYKEGRLVLEGESEGTRADSSAGIELSPAEKGDTRTSVLSVLSKLGGTPFSLKELDLPEETGKLFIPRSVLSKLRQELTPKLEEAFRARHLENRPGRDPSNPAYRSVPFFKKEAVQSDNILNPTAKRFAESHGAVVTQEAYEKMPLKEQPVMTTKHCIRYELGMCPTLLHYDEQKLHDPWKLISTAPDAAKVEMRLEFDCPNCRMLLYKAD